MLRTFFTRKATMPPTNSAISKGMAVRNTWKPGWSRAELIHTLTLLACHKEGESLDPFSKALAAHLTNQGAHVQAGAPVVFYRSDLTSDMGGTVWHHGRQYELAIHGTPETVLAYCDITESEREDVYKMFAMLGNDSPHVIAVAYGIVQSAPSTLGELPKKEKLIFTGLVSLT